MPTTVSQTERIAYTTIVLVVFVYAALRSVWVPVVHDEAATFFHYIQLNKFLPGDALWDANNHILNTALALLSVNLFGPDPFWLRLPNLLSFLLFAFYLLRLAALLENRYVRWLTWAAMLTASFQLEFFSLARGYGMSMAFLLGTIWHALQYLSHHKVRELWLAWIWIALALLANMSLMNTILALGGIFLFDLFWSNKTRIAQHGVALFIVGGALVCSGSWYAYELKSRGLLYTGSTDGFISVTVASLVRVQMGTESFLVTGFCIGLGLLAASYLLWHSLMVKRTWSAGALVAGLLLLNASGAVLLALLFGVNFPEERTGLYFVPLFLLLIGFFIDSLASNNPMLQWLALPLIWFPIEWIATANWYTSHLWPELHMNQALYREAAILQEAAAKPLRVSGRHMYPLAWSYDHFIHRREMQIMEFQNYPDTTADLIIAWPGSIDFSSLHADTLYIHPKSRFSLLKPRNALEIKYKPVVFIDKLEYSGTAPYFNLAIWQTNGAEHGMVSLSFSPTDRGRVLHGQIVITAQNQAGETIVYDYVPLHWLRKNWSGETHMLRRAYRFPEETHKALVYFWNMDQTPADILFEHIVVER